MTAPDADPSPAPSPSSFPDEVPVADAVEQSRPVTEPDESDGYADPTVPLESDPADWQEQREVVEDSPEDY